MHRMAQDRSSISLTVESKERLRDAKTYDDEPWEGVIRRLLQHYELLQSFGLSDGDTPLKPCGKNHPLPCGVDEDCALTDAATESVGESIATIESRVGNIERTLEEMGQR